ncbi:MAG: tetratricopeptide repeat protein, partial [Dokdonella sp.]
MISCAYNSHAIPAWTGNRYPTMIRPMRTEHVCLTLFSAALTATLALAQPAVPETPSQIHAHVKAAWRTQQLADGVATIVQPAVDLVASLFGPYLELPARRALGDAYLALGSVEPARSSWLRVGELASRLHQMPDLVRALEVGGDLQLQAGDGESAQISAEALLSVGHDDAAAESIAWRLRGVARRRDGKLDAALNDLKTSAALAREANDHQALGDALNALGSLYRDQGDFANALEAHLQALDARLPSGHRLDTTYRNIALLYREIEDLNTALDYLDRADAIASKQGNAFGMAPILGSRAAILNDLGRYTDALDSADQAALIDQMSGHRSSSGFDMVESGRALIGLGRVDDGVRRLQQGLAIGRETGVLEIVARALLPMAGLAVQRHHLGNARNLLDEANAVLQDARLRPQLIEYFTLLGQLAVEQGDYQTALQMSQRHAAQLELLLGSRASRQLAELKVRNARLASEQALDMLKNRNELQETRLRTQALEQRLSWYSIAALILLVGAGCWRYIAVRRRNSELREKNREIESQRAMLRSANDRLLIQAHELHAISIRDSLTGAYSRAHLMQQLQEMVPPAIVNGSQLNVLMIDLDHFKLINDRRGHLHGDAVLIAAV